MTQFPTGLSLLGTDSGLNVFSVTAAQLNAATFIKIKVPQGATILVNVSGTTINMNQGPLGTVSIWDPVTGQYIVDNHFINGLPVPSTAWLTLRQSLLWNFSTATSILKNPVSWPGTILAPQAHFQFGQGTVGPGHINGSLISDSVDSVVGAETHDMPFVGGCLPEAPTPPLPTGSIGIIKQITGPPPGTDTTFEFSVDCGSDGGIHDVAIQVPAGQSSGQASVGDLPVGTVCTVTETSAPPGYDPVSVTPNPVTVSATEDPPATVTATDNHQLGQLQLVKTLDRPAPVAGLVTLHVSCTDGTDQDVELTVPAGSSSAETVIGGIAVGAVCTVTETAAPPDWQAVSISPASIAILPIGNPPVTVTAADSVRLGALQLIKQINLPVATDTSFTLHVDCDGTAFDTDVTITVPAGASSADAAPISGIPFGTTCTVTEPTPPAGWKVQAIDPSAVVIGSGGENTVIVTVHNATIKIVDAAGSLQLVKQLTGLSDGVAHSFTLHVVCTPDGFTTDATLTVPAGDTTAAVTLTGLTPGASCTISEPTPTPGFTLTSISPNPIIIVPGDQPTVVVTATNDRQLGSLDVIKQLSAAATSPAQFALTLDCDGTDFDRNIALDIPAGASTANTVVSGLPVGLHCNLSEPQPPTGYQLTSITPSGGVTVESAPDTAVITATNTAVPGAIQIIKQLTGGTADEALPIQLVLACTNPNLTRDVQITLPAGASAAQTLETGLPVGANCTVTEPAPPAPLAAVDIAPTTVTVEAGPPATVTVTNHLDDYTGQLTKQITVPAAAPVTFTFLLACNDPRANRQLTLTVPVGATQSSLTAPNIRGNVACTLSEPEIAGWTLVNRTPSNGTITAATPTVTFLNQPDPSEKPSPSEKSSPTAPAQLAATGIAQLGLLVTSGMLAIVFGALLTMASTIHPRRRRRT